MAKDGKFHIIGFLCALIFGLLLGGIVYILTKTFNLKSRIWFIPFFFMPPVIGAIIYALSNKR
ncbi:hypothetical protein [Malacoplasma iowae]|uniref:Uncharacterized protein n=1 Tax=Malacoplasma iowae 695 TaxID=1048830 RepID=A0A6P1LKX7_MALIO|nr:hypothetical protein [Malacoplasma iowae]VEU63175.1 Uncharacterised protein [Mycoplasmopsis fermentans]EGZ31268.1 hypothetical protein GUU_02798 [Malacoplasma iowae 695]QHG89563.1 hypothetical protein EER00_01445 [Malacoplasma iowae 695]WPL35658.1 hypothetical protein QX180_05030 [Malacoplasma iowae]WPL36809.1 hypothetical protein QX179_05290 [Malacoplasma iowae]